MHPIRVFNSYFYVRNIFVIYLVTSLRTYVKLNNLLFLDNIKEKKFCENY